MSAVALARSTEGVGGRPEAVEE